MRSGGAIAPNPFLLATCHTLTLGFASRVRDLGIGGNKASLHPEISCLNLQPFVSTGKIALEQFTMAARRRNITPDRHCDVHCTDNTVDPPLHLPIMFLVPIYSTRESLNMCSQSDTNLIPSWHWPLCTGPLPPSPLDWQPLVAGTRSCSCCGTGPHI